MAAPVSVLISAHAETGAGRFRSVLEAADYEPHIVLASTEQALSEALAQEKWDVLVMVPGVIPVAAAIASAREMQPGVPVIIADVPAGADARLRAAGADAVVPAGEIDRLGEAVSSVLTVATPPPLTVAPAADPRALAVQDLAEHLPIGLYQTRPDGRIIYANEALPLVLGFDSREELADIDVRRDIGYPREHFEAQMARYGSVRNLVVRWTDRTGRTVYTREHARAVRDSEGNVSYFEGTMEDVTAEYSAREREVRRTRQFATIVQFATDVDGVRTVEEVYSSAVGAAEVVTGAGRVLLITADDEAGARCVATSAGVTEDGLAEATERGHFERVPMGTEPLVLSDLRHDSGGLDPLLVEFLLQRSVGALAVYPLIYHGRTRGAFVVCYDEPYRAAAEELQVVQALAWHVAGALARHEAEADLRDSEACLRFIDQHTDHVLFRLRYSGSGATFDYLSPAVEALVGYSASDLEERGGLGALIEEKEVLEGDGLMEEPPALEALTGDGAPPRYVARYRMRTAGGETRWVENVAYTWTDAEGLPVGLVGTLVDVTERKRREEARAAEAERALELQRTLVEIGALGGADIESFVKRVTEVAVRALDVDRALVRVAAPEGAGRCLDMFEAVTGAHAEREDDMPAEQFASWLEEHGRTRSIAVGDTLVDPRSLSTSADAYFRDHDIGAILSASIRQQGRVSAVLALHHLGGPRVWTPADLEFAASLADLLALALERAERLRAEAALREQELRYRVVSELTTDYAFAVRIYPDGRDEIEWATGAFAQVTGYSADEIDAIEGLLGLFHPDCVSVVRNALALLDAGEAVDFEGRIRTKKGEERWVRHRARPGAPAPDGSVIHYHGGEDITDRKRFEQELISAREQAEEMARLKSAFLANMSHEIRTPLTGILGYAGILADEITDEEHRESVEFIERSGHRLLATLDSVLELARLEGSGVRPHVEVLDVGSEVRQTALLLAPVAEAKGLELKVLVGSKPARARLDRTCLARILNNLVGNAVKFTDRGGIVVDVSADDAHAHIRITDTGVGIDEAFLPRIFDEFRQESDGDARNHEGAGLGLAITRRLVDVLGGAVGVESRKGVGTTVTVTFPLAEGEPVGAEEPAAETPSESTAEIPQGDDIEEVDADLAFLAPAAQVEFAGPSADDEILAPPVDEEPADDPTRLIFEDPFSDNLLEDVIQGGDSEEFGADSVLLPPPLPPVAPESDDMSLAGDGDVPEPALLDMIYPPDDSLNLAWADEEVETEGDGSWVAAADANLEALFAPIGPMRDAADGIGIPDDTPSETDQPADVEQEVPPPLDTNAMEAEHPENTGSGTPNPPASDSAQGPVVLVVEDNSDTRALLERILRSGFVTYAVGDARSALDLLHRETFDALVLDINLGGRETGVDVLKVARSLPGNQDLFAIALTAYALPGDRERFLEAGFNQYVSKPFTRSTLLAALKEGLGEVAP